MTTKTAPEASQDPSPSLKSQQSTHREPITGIDDEDPSAPPDRPVHMVISAGPNSRD